MAESGRPIYDLPVVSNEYDVLQFPVDQNNVAKRVYATDLADYFKNTVILENTIQNMDLSVSLTAGEIYDLVKDGQIVLFDSGFLESNSTVSCLFPVHRVEKNGNDYTAFVYVQNDIDDPVYEYAIDKFGGVNLIGESDTSAGVLSWNGMTGNVLYTPPVTSVNGMTGDVIVQGGGSSDVLSVNGRTGAVVLTASDVGALPDDTVIPTKTSDLTNDSGFITSSDVPTQAVTSVNGKTGVVVLDADDVGALPDDAGVIRYDEAQTLTEGQKTQARANLGVSNASDKFDVYFGYSPNSETVRIANGYGTQVTGQTIKDKITVSYGGCILVVPDNEDANHFMIYDLDDYTTSGSIVFYRIADGYRYTITVPMNSNIGTKAKEALVDSGGGGDEPQQIDAVLYTPQNLTDSQKRVARRNLGMPGFAVPLWYELIDGQTVSGNLYRINPDGTHETTPLMFRDLYKLYSDDKNFIFAYEGNGNVYKLKTVSTSEMSWNMIDGNTETVLSINVGSEGSQSSQVGVAKSTVTIGGGGGQTVTDAVLYTEQSLTDSQKAQARTNIGAFPLLISMSYSNDVWSCNKDASWLMSNGINSMLYYQGNRYFVTSFVASGGNTATIYYQKQELDSSNADIDEFKFVVQNNAVTITRMQYTHDTSGSVYEIHMDYDSTTQQYSIRESPSDVRDNATNSILIDTRTDNIYVFSGTPFIDPSYAYLKYVYDNTWLTDGTVERKYVDLVVGNSIDIGMGTTHLRNLPQASNSQNGKVLGVASGNYTFVKNGSFVIPVSYNGSAYTTTVTAAEILENKNDLAVEYANMHFSLKSSFSSDPNSYYTFYFSCEYPQSNRIDGEWFSVECNNGAVTITRIAKDIVLVPYYSNSDNDKSLVVRNGALVWDSPVNYYSVTLNANGTVNTKDSSLSWSTISARMSNESYTDYLLVTWGNSLFTAEAVEMLSNDDIKFIADVEHDGIQRHMIFTLTSANALQTTLIETYARVPATVWEVANVTQGLIALNTNISSSLAWQLTGLNLSPFKRIKIYAKAGRKTGAAAQDSSIVPAVIIEMLLDDRAKETVSQNVFIGSAVVQNPNDANRLGTLTCAVSGDKTKFAVTRATSLYGTAATSNTDCYQYVFKIEGYYD